jgi:hypothetical protein
MDPAGKFDTSAINDASAAVAQVLGRVEDLRRAVADVEIPVAIGISSADLYSHTELAWTRRDGAITQRALRGVQDRLEESERLLKHVRERVNLASERAAEEEARRASVGETLNV